MIKKETQAETLTEFTDDFWSFLDGKNNDAAIPTAETSPQDVEDERKKDKTTKLMRLLKGTKKQNSELRSDNNNLIQRLTTLSAEAVRKEKERWKYEKLYNSCSTELAKNKEQHTTVAEELHKTKLLASACSAAMDSKDIEIMDLQATVAKLESKVKAYISEYGLMSDVKPSKKKRKSFDSDPLVNGKDDNAQLKTQLIEANTKIENLELYIHDLKNLKRGEVYIKNVQMKLEQANAERIKSEHINGVSCNRNDCTKLHQKFIELTHTVTTLKEHIKKSEEEKSVVEDEYVKKLEDEILALDKQLAAREIKICNLEKALNDSKKPEYEEEALQELEFPAILKYFICNPLSSYSSEEIATFVTTFTNDVINLPPLSPMPPSPADFQKELSSQPAMFDFEASHSFEMSSQSSQFEALDESEMNSECFEKTCSLADDMLETHFNVQTEPSEIDRATLPSMDSNKSNSSQSEDLSMAEFASSQLDNIGKCDTSPALFETIEETSAASKAFKEDDKSPKSNEAYSDLSDDNSRSSLIQGSSIWPPSYFNFQETLLDDEQMIVETTPEPDSEIIQKEVSENVLVEDVRKEMETNHETFLEKTALDVIVPQELASESKKSMLFNYGDSDTVSGMDCLSRCSGGLEFPTLQNEQAKDNNDFVLSPEAGEKCTSKVKSPSSVTVEPTASADGRHIEQTHEPSLSTPCQNTCVTPAVNKKKPCDRVARKIRSSFTSILESSVFKKKNMDLLRNARPTPWFHHILALPKRLNQSEAMASDGLDQDAHDAVLAKTPEWISPNDIVLDSQPITRSHCYKSLKETNNQKINNIPNHPPESENDNVVPSLRSNSSYPNCQQSLLTKMAKNKKQKKQKKAQPKKLKASQPQKQSQILHLPQTPIVIHPHPSSCHELKNALNQLDRIKFHNDAHSHNQFKHAFINKLKNPAVVQSCEEIVEITCEHLASAPRNPFSSYILTNNMELLLPRMEMCMIDSFCTLRSINKVRFKNIINIFITNLEKEILHGSASLLGLTAFCRTYSGLCRFREDQSPKVRLDMVWQLIYNLLDFRSELFPFCAASILSVWPDAWTERKQDGMDSTQKYILKAMMEMPLKDCPKKLWNSWGVCLKAIKIIFKEDIPEVENLDLADLELEFKKSRQCGATRNGTNFKKIEKLQLG